MSSMRYRGTCGGQVGEWAAHHMPDLARSIERQYADPGRVVDRWARQFLNTSGPTGVVGALATMTRTIHKEFSYAQRLAGGTR